MNKLETKGEFDLPRELIPFEPSADCEGLFSVLKGGLRNLTGGFKRTLGDKKRLTIVIALVIIWFLVNVLAMSGIYPFPIRLLSWLSAARGSLIRGAIGKGLIAALLAQIIINKEIIQNMKGGMNQLYAMIKGGKESYSLLLFGMGAALIACNMMVSSNLQNTMVSIAAFVFSLRSLTRNGFLRQLITSLLPKSKDISIAPIMGGWALGFFVFTAISFLPGGKNGYFIGFLLLVIGAILEITNKNKKEVATK